MTAREKEIIIKIVNEANFWVEESCKEFGVESKEHEYFLGRWNALYNLADALGIIDF